MPRESDIERRNLNKRQHRYFGRDEQSDYDRMNSDRNWRTTNQRGINTNSPEDWNRIQNNLRNYDMDAQLAWTDNDEDRAPSHPRHHGGFYGKGPKNWEPSDDRIFELVSEALYRNEQVDASEIEVSVKDGIVYLVGSVNNRETKRAAEECVEEIIGVTDIHNELK